MTTFHTNGVLFENVFGTPEMREIFSEERFIQRFLDVEAALARVQAREGMIPESAAAEITEKASLEHVDFDQVEANVADVHLFSMSIIGAWKESMGEAGEYVHWGRRRRTSPIRRSSSRSATGSTWSNATLTPSPRRSKR